MVALVLVGATIAWAHGRPPLPAWLWVSLLLYPLWGLVQQWLVQALVVDNLRELYGLGLPGLMIVGAIGFGAIHVQHPPLMLATAALGAFYVFLFQRWRNLWPLAVCHGWLGSLFCPWVLGRNPVAELVGSLSASSSTLRPAADHRDARLQVSTSSSRAPTSATSTSFTIPHPPLR